jgi:F-type H+-transporting ATPase subunit gamma
MPQLTREIKRRIKSIGNTKKITKAMELVSASKMRKAVNNVLMSRPYANLSWQTVLNLASRTQSKFHPLLFKRPIKKIGLILVTSNRGLCGSFNNQVINKAVSFIKQEQKNLDVKVESVVLGKKGRDAMLKHNSAIVAEFAKLDITTKVEDIRALSRLVIKDYLVKKFDQVLVVYTDYISSLSQKPRVLQLLPIDVKSVDKYLGVVKSGSKETAEAVTANFEYLFEPSPDKVLAELLPRLIEVKIYQAILESDASEHSARMISMQNASGSASDMIDSLTLAFNSARQSAITSELADISGGKAALE